MKVRQCLMIGAALTLTVGCELLNVAATQLEGPELGYRVPELQLSEATLVAYPSGQDIAAFYCEDIVPFPANLGCAALGPIPSERQMQFHFELQYLVDNPNPTVSIPTTEILASIRLFEGTESAELGAVCVALCNEGDLSCTGQPGENSCVSDRSDTISVEDIQDRLIGLLELSVDAAINGELDNVSQRVIPAGTENFEIRVRFSLGADAMEDILGTVLRRLVVEPIDLLAGDLQIDIPFTVSGSLWFEVPIIGRVALGYGPFTDVWSVEVPSFRVSQAPAQ